MRTDGWIEKLYNLITILRGIENSELRKKKVFRIVITISSQFLCKICKARAGLQLGPCSVKGCAVRLCFIVNLPRPGGEGL